ncbi:MAG: MmgE/PrpD family protein [Microthrixaceae bacterium]
MTTIDAGLSGASTLLEQLASLATATTIDNLPAEQAASVPQRVVDVLGIAVRATTLPTSEAVTGYAVEQGGTPKATAIGAGRRLPAASAAFVNGVLAHSLDYDDTHLPSILHPSASVVPAALATAQAHGRAGSDVVPAVAVGLEVAVRLGMAGYDRESGENVWFDRGQHATSICGTIGSAAASAKLMGLDDAQIGDAMAVAASMASGIIEANRTGGTVKRLHCGWAAQAGVTAAELTARGLSGPPTVFEGRFGLLGAFLGDRARPEEVTDGLSEHPEHNEWAVADIFYKPYPANHYTHCGIDAAIQLRDEGLVADEVESAHLGVAEATVRTIGDPIKIKQSPDTGYQAQFSGPYTVAAALLGGVGLGLGLSDFDDELVADPYRKELMSRITVGADPRCDEIYPNQFPAVLTVRTKGGSQLVAEVLANRGGPQRPLSDSELGAKFSDNASGLLSAAERNSVLAAAAAMDTQADLESVMGPLGRPLG